MWTLKRDFLAPPWSASREEDLLDKTVKLVSISNFAEDMYKHGDNSTGFRSTRSYNDPAFCEGHSSMKDIFSFLEIFFWCAQDFYFLSRRKAWQGRRLQCRRTRKTKREEQHTVSVGLTTRSKWFPFRVFTEIFILDFVQSSAAAAMARPRRKKNNPFPPTSFFFLVLVSLWLPCTHSPPPPPRHSYPSFGCVAAAAALPLRW